MFYSLIFLFFDRDEMYRNVFYSLIFLFFDRDEIYRNVFYTFIFLWREISLTSKMFYFKNTPVIFTTTTFYFMCYPLLFLEITLIIQSGSLYIVIQFVKSTDIRYIIYRRTLFYIIITPLWWSFLLSTFLTFFKIAWSHQCSD